MQEQPSERFAPALVVVDFQEDFCAPNGALGVTGGREIASSINELTRLPFTKKIATQDWHPQDHVSFASNHPGPNNYPFESVIFVKNPLNEFEREEVRLWPDHCLQDSQGAKLVPEFDVSQIDLIVKKGQDRRVEMFSAFRDTYKQPCVSESGLGVALKDAGITHCFVVGLATDYCVKHTALHAAAEGYTTYVVSEATEAVDQSESAKTATAEELRQAGIHFVSMSGPELDRLRNSR